MPADSSTSRRFAIALTFPGEHRDYVEQVATSLLTAFGGVQGKARVFYDAWHESKVIGYGSNRKLQTIYAKDSDLIVPFYCQDYLAKQWCGVELRAIEELLFDQQFDRVLPFRFDMVDIPSSFKTDVFPVVTGRPPEDIARLIVERYNEVYATSLKLPEPPDGRDVHAIRQGLITAKTNHELHDSASSRGLSAACLCVDISRIGKYAPAELIGREAETKILTDAWGQAVRAESNRPHVLTFVALGGEGKTSLVAKWAASLAHDNWPGCDAVFAWSFYSQGTREQTAVSSDLFLTEALTFFGDAAMAGSAQGAFEKGRRLAQLVGERRALLILDGLEPLQYAPTSPTPGELKDQGLSALLKGLAATSHGLCVVTTRYALPDLRAYLGGTVREEKLARLARAAGVQLLKAHGVIGSDRRNLPLHDGDSNSELVSEFEKLVEDVKGHALTLNLLGTYLRDAHAGDIRKRDLVKLEEADANHEHKNHAFHVMDAYVKWLAPTGFRARVRWLFSEKEREHQTEGRRSLALLRLMGLFDRPATVECVAALWKAPAVPGLTEPLIGLSDAQRNLSLKRLEDAKLLTVNRASGSGELVALDAHPLLREYFARRVREQQPEAWRAAHRRLYEHLCASTQEGDQPTLEDLQPLYQAVAHGCQAGLQQEALLKVYDVRIKRRNEDYSRRKLGAYGSGLGALACFFEIPWSRVSPALTEDEQSWLLSNTAFDLRALGRLTEALEPVRVGLIIRVKEENWKRAAAMANNLSELELMLGEVAGAVGDAEQSVTYADRSGDAQELMEDITTHADALHQAGRQAEAKARFREAEQMLAGRQPDYPLLYGVTGFRYCDLLLAEAERAAWQVMLRMPRSVLECGGRDARGHPGIGDTAFARSSDIEEPHPDAGGVSAAGRGTESTAPAKAVSPPLQGSATALQDAVAPNDSDLATKLRAVSERAAKTLKWAEDNNLSLLTIALDHLTLGRAALYAAILGNFAIRHSSFDIDPAVSGLRRAGQQYMLVLGLLTRAWQRSLTGALTSEQAGPDSAQADLDEAWEIAERGPMRLFMADIRLTRCRLFGIAVKTGQGVNGQELKYPWESPEKDLAEARKLIVACGYGRRMPELEDAEKALKTRV